MSDARGADEADAARAFEALREEVASLRHGIELVYRQGQEAKSVDYSLTLGQMAKTLQELPGRLAALEGKPALAMTPAVYREQIAEAGRIAAEIAGQALREGAAAQREAARELREVTSQAHEAREQRRWLATAAALGVIGGLLLWTILVEVLPWGIGTWLAAVPIAGDKWDAGLQLLREASPSSYEKMVRLYGICGNQPLEFCAEAVAARTVDSVRQEGAAPAGAAPARPRQAPRP